MVAQGVEATLAAYGASSEEATLAAREGVLALTRWTSQLRERVRGCDGHFALMSSLRHAAYTDDGALLFVHAGIDPQRPLSAQSDSFWWGGSGFAAMAEPYDGYRLVVRGFDRRHGGFQQSPVTVTLDAGCGFGGTLMAACFGPEGGLAERFEV